MRTEQIGDCTLYLGDCLEVLPTLGMDYRGTGRREKDPVEEVGGVQHEFPESSSDLVREAAHLDEGYSFYWGYRWVLLSKLLAHKPPEFISGFWEYHAAEWAKRGDPAKIRLVYWFDN